MNMFKSGDLVRFKPTTDNFDYVVRFFANPYEVYKVKVVLNENILYLVGFNVGVCTRRLELVSASKAKKPTTGFDALAKADLAKQRQYIVALERNGLLKPSPTPYLHSDKAAAVKEAQRLAGLHGGKFSVLETIAYAEAPKPVANVVYL